MERFRKKKKVLLLSLFGVGGEKREEVFSPSFLARCWSCESRKRKEKGKSKARAERGFAFPTFSRAQRVSQSPPLKPEPLSTRTIAKSAKSSSMATERCKTASFAENERRVFVRRGRQMSTQQRRRRRRESKRRRRRRRREEKKKDRNLNTHLQAFVERVRVHLHGGLLSDFRARRRREQGLLSA